MTPLLTERLEAAICREHSSAREALALVVGHGGLVVDDDNLDGVGEALELFAGRLAHAIYVDNRRLQLRRNRRRPTGCAVLHCGYTGSVIKDHVIRVRADERDRERLARLSAHHELAEAAVIRLLIKHADEELPESARAPKAKPKRK